MASIMGLHLQYRLWIAEMNADINVLRIFDDHLNEISAKQNNSISDHVNNYKEQFPALRKELDDLRHEMHLVKMKLASLAKTGETPNNIEETINHENLKEHYMTFRKAFEKTQKEFQEIEVV